MNSIVTPLNSYKDEIWVWVPGYEGKYLVSTYGRILTVHRKRAFFLKQYENNKGYYRVALCKDGKTKFILTHRLVAMAFIDNDDPEVKTTVDHIDGDKHNNQANNLRWLSLGDNIRAHYMNQVTTKEAA